jgi:hypothetical protein
MFLVCINFIKASKQRSMLGKLDDVDASDHLPLLGSIKGDIGIVSKA